MRRPDGFLNLMKSPGITSRQAAEKAGFLMRASKAGHTGTLDPLASGVLLVCLGKATRLSSFVADASKAYRAELTLGVSTDTLDSEGQVSWTCDSSGITEQDISAALPRFIGDIEQAPPAFSAVRKSGRRLYSLAREGKPVAAEPRKVRVDRIELLSFSPGSRARALLEIECAKGTYVRALCADIASALRCAGHLSFLLRTRVGEFQVSDSITLEELRELGPAGARDLMIPMDRVVAHLPCVRLSEEEASVVLHGGAVDGEAAGLVRLHDEKDNIIGLARCENGRLHPFLVLGG
jgi:tRNA pseudouridine55 synthase